MSDTRIVLGILDISRAIGNDAEARALREYTIAWSRYGYQGDIVERDSVDGILETAEQTGFDYCLILSYGWILDERWRVDDAATGDFFDALVHWTAGHNFLIAGSILHDANAWYGLASGCLLVDLQHYRRCGRPTFVLAIDDPVDLPRPTPQFRDGHLVALRPGGQVDKQFPRLPGWDFVRCSLENELPVLSLAEELSWQTLDLQNSSDAGRAALLRYSGDGIRHYDGDNGRGRDLSPDQRRFLDSVSRQTSNARNGVFLWNIESYADIESPRESWSPPTSTLYSVAAGFKPNRILHTHGFHPTTKVVYFDYSHAALEIKRCLVDQWDGDDFPDFVGALFQQFPSPPTFYQLWNDATPNDVDRQDLDAIWRRELDRWGGARAFAEHWQAYRVLEHEYVCCDIMVDPSALVNRIDREPNAVIWWSNAFFTMYGNWFQTFRQRQLAYEGWIEQLVRSNPQLDLYGSDFNNTSVNGIQAADYWQQYRCADVNGLTPFQLRRIAIRM